MCYEGGVKLQPCSSIDVAALLEKKIHIAYLCVVDDEDSIICLRSSRSVFLLEFGARSLPGCVISIYDYLLCCAVYKYLRDNEILSPQVNFLDERKYFPNKKHTAIKSPEVTLS